MENKNIINLILDKYAVNQDIAERPSRCRVILFNEGLDKIALIRREKKEIPIYYCLPGGGLEKEDNSILEGMYREIKEELSIERGDIIFLSDKVIVEHDVCKNEVKEEQFMFWIFLGISKNQNIKITGPEIFRNSGIYEAVWIPLNEVQKLNIRYKYLKKYFENNI